MKIKKNKSGIQTSKQANKQKKMDSKNMMIKSVEQSYMNFGISVVEALSEEYGFNKEEALEKLNMTYKISRKDVPKKKMTKKENPKVPTTVLPFCGEVMKDCCQGIRPNHGLFTQCQMTKLTGKEYCKTCNKQAEESETKKPKNGNINDRVNNPDWRSPDGKTPKNYGNVMKKLNISRTQADESATMMGWTIPETEYEFKKSKAGRPKSPATSDTDDEAPAKKRGRPAKKPKETVVKSDTGDDVIANLMSKMDLDDDTSSEEESSETDNIISEPTNITETDNIISEPTNITETDNLISEPTNVTTVTETLEGVEETKNDDVPPPETKKTKKAKKEKPELTDEEKAAKKAATQKKRKETMARKKAEKEAEEAKEPEKELEKELDEEDDDLSSQPDTSDDEGPTCEEFEFKGTKYYKDSKTNELYSYGNPDDAKKVGMFDEENQCIKPVEE
jgi:hypothetical protein